MPQTPAVDANMPYGSCPWAGGAFPVAAPPTALALPTDNQGGGIVTVAGPCAGPKCQLWDGSTEMCSLKHIAFLPVIAEAITPARNVDPPDQGMIAALAQAVRELTAVVIKALKKLG